MGRWAFFSTGVEYKFAFGVQSSEAILRLDSDIQIKSNVGNWTRMIEVKSNKDLKTKMQTDFDTLVMRFGSGGEDEEFVIDLAAMNQLIEEESNYWVTDVTFWQWSAAFPKDRIHQLLETYKTEWERLVGSTECPEFQTPSSDDRMAAYGTFVEQQRAVIFANAGADLSKEKGEALWDLFLLGSILFQLKFMLEEDDESLGVHWEW